MAFKYIVADPEENAGLTHDFGDSDVSIRLICHAPDMNLLQLDLKVQADWRPATKEEISIFKSDYGDKDGIFHLDPLDLDINRGFTHPSWANRKVLDFDAAECRKVEEIIEEVGEEVEAIEGYLREVWAAMSAEERTQLIYTPEGVQNIGSGGLSKLGVFDDSEYGPWEFDWDDLGLSPDDLVIWLESAEQHAADTGEPEHVIGDLHDLIRGIGLVIGEARARDQLVKWKASLDLEPKP